MNQVVFIPRVAGKFGLQWTPRILIVDDNDQLRDVVRAFLESRGFDVCGEGTNDTEAIERAGELKPDLITMGLAMPLLNGTEAASAITRSAVKPGV